MHVDEKGSAQNFWVAAFGKFRVKSRALDISKFWGLKFSGSHNVIFFSVQNRWRSAGGRITKSKGFERKCGSDPICNFGATRSSARRWKRIQNKTGEFETFRVGNSDSFLLQKHKISENLIFFKSKISLKLISKTPLQTQIKLPELRVCELYLQYTIQK